MKNNSSNDGRWSRIEWVGKKLLKVDNILFELVTWNEPARDSSPERFVLIKDREFSDSLKRTLEGKKVKKIVEFGLYHGGSVVFFDKIFIPEKIVGIETRENAPILDNYIEKSKASGRIFPVYSTSQDDEVAVSQILESHFPDNDIDLIIDDASHLYSASKSTFEVAFPKLCPGGTYIIEDWGWAHWRKVFSNERPFAGKPLSQLILEIVLAHASAPEIISHINIDRYNASITRGNAEMDDPFRLQDHQNFALSLDKTASW